MDGSKSLVNLDNIKKPQNFLEIALLSIFLLILVPLFLIEVPPLGDYPNHLARFIIVNGLIENSEASPFFKLLVQPVPNITSDFLALLFTQVFTPYIAGKIIIGLTLVITLGGICFLHKTLFAHWSFWPLMFSLFTFNQILMSGFINYALGIGLSLLFAGLWIRISKATWSARLLAGLGMAFCIYFTHVLAFAIFAFCIASIELHNFFSNQYDSLTQRILKLLLTALPFTFPLLLFLSTSDFFHHLESQVVAQSDTIVSPLQHSSILDRVAVRAKLFTTMTGTGYSTGLDIAALTFLVIALAYAVIKRCIFFNWLFLTMACAFAILFLFLPDGEIFHVVALPIRFPIIILIFVIVGTDIRPNMPRYSLLFSLGLMLFTARLLLVMFNWYSYKAELMEFRAAFSHVEPGKKVFSIKPDTSLGEIFQTEPDRQLYLNSLLNLHQLQVLMIAERNAYTPYFFTHPQKQILRVRKAFNEMDYQDGGVPTPWSMAIPLLKNTESAPPFLNEPIWQPTSQWWRKYDYLTVLYPDYIEDLPNIDKNQFELIFQGRWIHIYKILHSPQ